MEAESSLSRSKQQASKPSTEVKELKHDLEKKISIPRRAARRVTYSNMMKGEVKFAKQYVVITKVLARKLRTVTLKAGLDVAWSPCRIVQFKR